VQTLQNHETVTNIIDAVVAETEKSSEVAGMKTETTRRWHWADNARGPATGNTRSPSEDRRVTGTTTSVQEAERSLWQKMNLGHEPEVLQKYSGPWPWRQQDAEFENHAFRLSEECPPRRTCSPTPSTSLWLRRLVCLASLSCWRPQWRTGDVWVMVTLEMHS